MAPSVVLSLLHMAASFFFPSSSPLLAALYPLSLLHRPASSRPRSPIHSPLLSGQGSHLPHPPATYYLPHRSFSLANFFAYDSSPHLFFGLATHPALPVAGTPRPPPPSLLHATFLSPLTVLCRTLMRRRASPLQCSRCCAGCVRPRLCLLRIPCASLFATPLWGLAALVAPYPRLTLAFPSFFSLLMPAHSLSFVALLHSLQVVVLRFSPPFIHCGCPFLASLTR